MLKKITYFLILLLFIPSLSNASITIDSKDNNVNPHLASSLKPALILYDSQGFSINNGYIFSLLLANLLGHFRQEYTIQSVELYKKSQINQFNPIFYLGTIYNNPLPRPFLKDVLNTSHTIVWFGYNLWQLNEFSSVFSKLFGFVYEYIDTSGYEEIYYKNKTFEKNSFEVELGKIKIIDPNLTHVYSTAKHKNDVSNQSIPYVIQGQNLWYFADIPFTFISENNRYLILADLLYDILKIDFSSKKRAIIRLEDINPTSDLTLLRAIADYLYEEHVPFGMAIIPYYVDSLGYYNQGKPQFIKMTESPEFIETLKYMISKGGSLIMHGYTHQYNQIANPYFGISGSDFEFYRIQLDSTFTNIIFQGSIAEDSLEWVQSRVAAAEALFNEAGLETHIWETPHYHASLLDNQFFSSHFSAQIGRITYYDKEDETSNVEQFFPYVIHRDIYGNKVIPENLGCVAPNQWFNFPSRTVSEILVSAEKNLAIRDAWASTCYHPFLGLSYLQKLVIGLKQLGYEFVSVSENLE